MSYDTRSARYNTRMRLSVVESLGKIPAAERNALAGDANPFLRHEFLHALEMTGCVGANTGWQPQST